MSQNSPIAIVGMSCRLPGGASTPQEFWEILRKGENAVTELDGSRFSKEFYHHPDPKARGKSYTWAAGVLSDIDAFDARFFGISPREAAQMDPQQRILLELAWEALEDGGQLPRTLAGTDCGVYVGISNMDYANSRFDDPSSGDAYFMTGGVLSIAANRISYFLDLHGPSMSIDTACSSSLVAVHQACESMARGECSRALVGGINLLLTPYPFIGFSNATMLSPSGRCHAFDASADGYVRAEGGAMLFLKPLDRAHADGDRIHAVITASGTNSDGRTSGLSLPNEKAQEQLIRSVYSRADLEPGSLCYIEAHGTGTAVGDPCEANAIGNAIGMARDHDDPLLIGSVKTNIGHLEPAAGIAGLLKVVLSLEHRIIPPTLNFKTPNPNIRFDDLNLRVVTETTALPDDGRPVVMGVNSFGFGGTNAHVAIARHQDRAPRRRAQLPGGSAPLLLSAQTPEGLVDAARVYREHIAATSDAIYDVCYTAALRRQHFDHRLAAIGDDKQDLIERLDEYVARQSGNGVVAGQILGRHAKLALLFSGNGSQWSGMGSGLLRKNRVFRDWVGRVDDLFRPIAGFSIIEELQRPPEKSSLHLTQVAQPALFALQVALLEVLLSKGLQPEAVFGHSVGEVAAAYASGAYTLEQATRLIYERSMAQAPTRGMGKLAAIGLSVDAIRAELDAFGGDLEIAAVNSPNSVTVTGSAEQLAALGASVNEKGALFRLLDIDYPFHSRAMDTLYNDLVKSLLNLKPYKTRLPFVSTVTGAVLDSDYLDGEYWWQNVRKPVRLDKAMTTLMADGFRVFMEVGPHPIMQGYLLESLNAASHPGRPLATLQRGKDDETQLREALYATHVLGCPLDLAKLYPVHGDVVSLPHYPWQRQPLWFESTSESYGLTKRTMDHPLLGYRMPQVEGIWENELDLQQMPFLADHVVGGSVVFPAAGFVEMAIAASLASRPDHDPVIEYLDIRAPLVLTKDTSRRMRLHLNSEDGSVSIQSRARLSDDPWTTHVVGRLTQQRGSTPVPDPRPTAMGKSTRRISGTEIYHHAESLGLSYGPSFCQLAEVEYERDIGIAHLRGEKGTSANPDQREYHLDPARLDSCFHGLIGIVWEHKESSSTAAYIPVRMGQVFYNRPGRDVAFSRITLTDVRRRSVTACFEVFDESGCQIAALEDVRFRRVQLVRDERQSIPVYENVALRHWPQSLTRAGHMRPLDLLAEAGARSLDAHGANSSRNLYFRTVLPSMERLLVSFAAAEIGQAISAEKPIGKDQLVTAIGVIPPQRPWFEYLIAMLEDFGVIKIDDESIALARRVSLEQAVEQWRDLLAKFPEYHVDLTLAGRCGVRLRELLSGEIALGDLISKTARARLRDASPNFQVLDGALRDLLKKLVSEWGEDRPIKMLELVPESDQGDSDLKDGLTKDRIEYTLARWRQAAPSSPDSDSVSGNAGNAGDAALELVMDDAASPPVNCSFDVIVIPHMLHRLDDPKPALEFVRRLLAPGGLLLATEQSPAHFFDFTLGAGPGWWRKQKSALSQRSSLRGSSAWSKELLACGFEAVESVTENGTGNDNAGALLLARNSAAGSDAETDSEFAARSFLLFSDDSGEARKIAANLERELRGLGHLVVMVYGGSAFRRLGANEFGVNPREADDFSHLFKILQGENKNCDDIVHLMGLTLAEDRDDTGLLEIQERRCLSTIRMIQALQAAEPKMDARLWLVTARAGVLEMVGGKTGDLPAIPSQAPLWGLGRVIANEHREFECRLVDLCSTDRAEAVRMLSEELRRNDQETEVVLASEGRYVSRMRTADVRQRRENVPAPTEEGSASVVQLYTDQPGSLARLQWNGVEKDPLKPGEVEVGPVASGLNFRDLMFASGLLPEEAIENGYAGATLGMECSGVVTARGEDVTEFEVGDEVVGFAPACFSSRIVTGPRTLAHKPKDWSFEQAATVPVAFFTVYYALHHLARLEPGERVLIHGAAGGVGLAAIQYARHIGAEIFATAGSTEKRDFLQLLGVDHVLDSRSLAFADEIREFTGGHGVDVVINSLSGEALRRSLGVLRPFGRFIELGKRDFYDNTRIGLRPFRENIAYFAVDADQLLLVRPDLAAKLFGEVMDLFGEGVFSPLPYRVFPASRAVDAFRTMQRSEHIGKIIINQQSTAVPVKSEISYTPVRSVRTDATYLVTGGLSGFGLATARWLVDQGATSLALLGRSGANTMEARTKVAELEQLGATVHVLQADVSDLASLKTVFDQIDGQLPPLRGLVHSAMVVDDSLVRNLDGKRMRRVLAPKLLGAWNLHALTRERDLDFFILYSSATTSFGNPGLANYVAANMYLESLVRLRRHQKLPGTAVSWGPISDSGYLARNDAALMALTSFMGSSGLTTRQGFKVLERLLESDISVGAVLEFDWSVIRRTLPTADLQRFAVFNRSSLSEKKTDQNTDSVKRILAQLPPKEAREAITEIVIHVIGEILRLSPDQVDRDLSIVELGMDSLMAIEMHMTITNRLGTNLPVMGLAEIPTVNQLVDKILSHEQPSEPPVDNAAEEVIDGPSQLHAGTGD